MTLFLIASLELPFTDDLAVKPGALEVGALKVSREELGHLRSR